MRWLKRNMVLVVGILIALGLLGGAIFYLVNNISAANSYQEEFEKVRAEFKNYLDMQPTPNKSNIELATADTKRLEVFMGDVRKLFKTPAYTKMDDPAFKSLLENTLSELSHSATNAAVSIPDKYSFTFTSQAKKLKFATNSVPALYMQLMEIKSMCNLLFQSKIHALESIKRAPVSADDTPPSGADYIDRRITTNAVGVVVPYEITFRCFSSELATVIESLSRAEEFFLIKNLVVQGEPPTLTTLGPPTETDPKPPTPTPTPTPTAPKGKGPAKPVAPKLIMDEKQLRVTMQIDLMRAPQPVVASASKAPVPGTAPSPVPAPAPAQAK